MPVAYLLGRREFYSMEFAARQQALVPRPETELLVEQALLLIPVEQELRICDLGTGSGIIAITLKKHRPLARVYASNWRVKMRTNMPSISSLSNPTGIATYRTRWFST